MRRALQQGSVRGVRTSARRIALPVEEERYLREHWPLLQRARAALRTEPNVRFAAVFGSVARGDAQTGADIDLLVDLADLSWERRQRLTSRLERALQRPVDLVVLERARHRNAGLLASILDE